MTDATSIHRTGLNRRLSMAHPNDTTPDGRCKVCGDRLTKVIRKKKGKRAFRRHLTNPSCETKGRGEAM
jgi:hypothetical protein